MPAQKNTEVARYLSLETATGISGMRHQYCQLVYLELVDQCGKIVSQLLQLFIGCSDVSGGFVALSGKVVNGYHVLVDVFCHDALFFDGVGNLRIDIRNGVDRFGNGFQ